MAEYSNKHNLPVMIAASLGAVMNPLLASMIILAMPIIGTEFSVSAYDLGWLCTAFLLANAIFLVPGSWFVDRFGYKKCYLIGSIILAIACALSIISPNYAFLLINRIFAGIGVSLIMVTGLAIVTRIYPKEKRGFVLGIYTTMVYVGLTLGPFLGGILTDVFGWQSLFVIMIPIVLISGILVFIFQKTEFKEATFKFDLIGMLLYAAATFLFMYGLSTITNPVSIVLTVIGLILLILFLYYEKKKEHPLLQTHLIFENQRFTRSSIAALLNYGAGFGVVFMVSLYLQSVGELNATQAGLILLFQPLIQVIVTPIGGKLADKINPKILVTLGMILNVVGIVMLSFVGLSSSAILWLITLSQVFIGIGSALFGAPNTLIIMNSVKKEEYSIASGIVSVVREYGMLISTAICMTAISVFIGGSSLLDESIYQGFTHAFQTAMLICAALGVIGIFFSWFRGHSPNEGEDK